MPQGAPTSAISTDSFHGFTSLDANFIYCPNQFLDLCLRYCTRNEIRAIAFVMLETLRWRDQDGNPVKQDIGVPYDELSTKANISRRAIKDALDGGVGKRFLVCRQEPLPKRSGQPAQTGVYALNWDYGEEFARDLPSFDGFFAGEGRRSPLPEEFFTVVIPGSTLGMIKVCGDVLRHTLGYQAQFGRRQQAPRSYSQIQAYTGIKDRKNLAQALKDCLAANYIERTESGVFDKDADVRCPAKYAPKWLLKAENATKGAEKPPAHRGKKTTSDSEQKTLQYRGNNPTSIGAANPPRDRCRKPSTRKREQKDILKQQGTAVARLMKEGFSAKVAQQLSELASENVIETQIQWMPFRKATSNYLGMLRQAIVENWAEPGEVSKKKAEKLEQQVIDATKSAETDSVLALEQRAAKHERERRAQLEAVRLQRQWANASLQLRGEAAQAVCERLVDPVEQERMQDHPLDEPLEAWLLELDTLLNATSISV